MMFAGAMLCTSVFGAAGDAWTQNLLPRPQVIDMHAGAFDLPPAFAGILTMPEGVAPDRLSARLTETLDGLSLKNRTLEGAPGATRFTLTIGEDTDARDETWSIPAQGYMLDITPTGVRIGASTEVGLFYGALTLAQIIETVGTTGAVPLPCLEVRDWPAIPLRGPHEDFGRDQLPTMNDLKRSIRTVAQYKMNTYLWFIEPDHFVYSFDSDISTDYDRFRFDEIRELTAYARQYYVDIIPVVELLAHMEMTLRHERYQGLSENGQGGGTLCPTSDASFELVRKMVDEIAPAFDSVYFHCGLDESQAVGQGRSAEAVKTKGLERVYADYYTRLDELVRSHGKTMIMYADIVLNHPAILDLLPTDIVMMFWDYAPRSRYEGLDQLAKTRFQLMTLSGLWDWCNLYPIYPAAFDNINVLAKQSAEAGALGHFVSSWGDGYRGAAGTNLSELNAYGFTYAGAVSWNPTPTPLDVYSGVFAQRFFGASDPKLAEALARLARCQGENLARNTQARRVLHDNLMHTCAAMMGADDETVAFWEHLRSETEAVERLLADVKATRNHDTVESMRLAARMLKCAADMALLGRSISADGAAAALPKLRELEARHRTLWDEYQKVWLATNRPLNLVHIGKAWNAASDEMGALTEAVASGKFPPVIVEGERLAFDFDGPEQSAWRSSLGPQVVLAPMAGAAPETMPGGPSGKGRFLHLPHGACLEGDDPERVLDFAIAPFLVQAWVRHTGQREQQYGATIFSYGLEGGFRLGINHEGKVLFTLYGIGEAACDNSIVPADGQWHHVAVNFHQGRFVDAYIDGKRTDQQTLIGFPRNPATPRIRIGNEIGLVTPFEGDVDRIRLSCGVFGAEDLDSKP